MTDGLGNQIEPGVKVVWVGGQTRYAGVEVYDVINLTPKRVRISKSNKTNSHIVDPLHLVVVDRLL